MPNTKHTTHLSSVALAKEVNTLTHLSSEALAKEVNTKHIATFILLSFSEGGPNKV